MKIKGYIIGFNLSDRINSDITIEDPHNKGKRIKIEMTRGEAEAMLERFTHRTLVTVAVLEEGEGI